MNYIRLSEELQEQIRKSSNTVLQQSLYNTLAEIERIDQLLSEKEGLEDSLLIDLSQEISTLQTKAVNLCRSGNSQEAKVIVRQLISNDHGNAEHIALMGMIYFKDLTKRGCELLGLEDSSRLEPVLQSLGKTVKLADAQRTQFQELLEMATSARECIQIALDKHKTSQTQHKGIFTQLSESLLELLNSTQLVLERLLNS